MPHVDRLDEPDVQRSSRARYVSCAMVPILLDDHDGGDCIPSAVQGPSPRGTILM